MLIPDNISDFNSVGEKILYLKFKNDGSTNSMYILHSLFTNHHIKNISGELDFFVLAPNYGFFSIEVKHGGVSRKNGDWCFTNREGKTTCKKTSPFAQQSATINSIRQYVLNKIEHKKELHQRFSKILWGSGVAFTSMTEFIDFGPEGNSWQVLTKQGLSLPIGSYIHSLSQGSHAESAKKYWYDVNKARPTKSDCEQLLKMLRGDFEINYSEINRIIEAEELIEEYTKEQFFLLDFVRLNDRCLVQGSAGTGKTLMALELLNRKISESLKVGLFCFNKELGKKLLKSAENIDNKHVKVVFCGTLHSYLAQKTEIKQPESQEDLKKFYEEDLPMEFLLENENLDDDYKIDFLIVDEAQDLITPYYLEVFNAILKGGIKNGKWVMFGDFSNQAIYLNNPNNSIDLLHSEANFTTFPPLNINCRNTKEIANQNTLMTGAQPPQISSKNYLANKVICKYPSKSSRKHVLLEILLEIEKRKIPLEKVTLLSPKKFENSLLWEDSQIKELLSRGLIISTIQAFKGLENSIIILFDFDEVSSLQMQRLLYVGISRARQELYLILDKSQEATVSKLVTENYPKLG
ncbi:MAG: ATP-binding domain-containing protein [Algoriphagus sp.]|nr:ATP-binding domain-containing protein [Algoriphagus sp.]